MRSTFLRVGKKNSAAIWGIFIEYDQYREIDASRELYEIRVFIVYDSELPGAKEAAKETEETLFDKFKELFRVDGAWRELEVSLCDALSDTEFTYYDAVRTNQYRLEHISFKQHPPVEPPAV